MGISVCFWKSLRNPVLLFLLCLMLLSCASPRWADRHPTYEPRLVSQETGMPDIGTRWILVRGSWFAEQMLMNPSEIYDSVGTMIQESFYPAISQKLPTIRLLSPNIIDSLSPIEAQKLDKTVYLKGRFPAQGQVVYSDGLAIPQILLVHELTVGPDLKRENLYDYEKANLDSEGRFRKVQNIKAIATWTLWDNHRQHYIASGITEVSIPWTNPKEMPLHVLIPNLMQELSRSMVCEMKGTCP